MALTIDELKELIQADEHRQLELKKTTGELKDGMHSACAFLNTEGGWLIFGAAPTWAVNGGFVVVTFMRPAKSGTQDVTQDVTQGVTQEDTLDEKIEKAIKDNLNITTEELAKQFGVTSMTIKRHLAKMPHIRYVGSGYSGHWEVESREGSLIR